MDIIKFYGQRRSETVPVNNLSNIFLKHLCFRHCVPPVVCYFRYFFIVVIKTAV